MTRPVTPTDQRWSELVREAVGRDASRNWFLGDAPLEIAPMGSDSAHNGATASLEAYVEEVGVPVASVRTYRDVAAAWPPPTRVGGTSHKVHAMLMAEGNRHLIRKGMTVTEAHRALGQSTAGRTGPRSDTRA